MESNVRYSIREAFRIFRKRRLSAAATVGVIALCLLIFGTFLVITVTLFQTINLVRERVEIDVFLVEGLSEFKRRHLTQEVRKLKGVERVEYISKDEALRRFRAELGEDSELIELLDTNPLPAMLRVIPKHDWKTEDRVQQIASQVKPLEGVEELEYGRRWVTVLDRVVRLAVGVDLALGLLVAVGVLFVIFNTVGLAISSASSEISVMIMVGATEGFVRGPYLVWGVLQGALGGIIASIALMFGADALTAAGVPFGTLPAFATSGLVVFGALLGGGGSIMAVWNVLRADDVMGP